MAVYLLNSLIVPLDFDVINTAEVRFTKIDIPTAKKILATFISAVGHESTAKLLTQLLEISVPLNRITIRMRKGDVAVHFIPKIRLPEGVILSKESLEKLDFWLIKSEVL